jgi:hypothetical protein
MKKSITTMLLALFALSFSFAQDLYIRFNKAPIEAGFLTGTQSPANGEAKAITFESENPTDAYLMDLPDEGSDIYKKVFTLPIGDYEYQVVFADGTGTQGEASAWTIGRPFSIAEEKAVVFRAKIVNGYIRFLCDAQDLYFSNTTNYVGASLLPEADETGNVQFYFTYSNYKGKLEACLFPQGNTTQFVADVLPAKGKYDFNGANGKVKWLLSYNRHTLTYEGVKKIVTLLDTDLVDTGDGLIPADELLPDLGTYSNSTPLLLSGGTTSVSARIGIDELGGAEKENNLLKIAPIDIEAKMYYNIYDADSIEVISEGNNILTTEAEIETATYQTVWTLDTPIDVTDGLSNGAYTLNIWYETVCHTDTVKSDIYTTAFSVYNENVTTGLQDLNSNMKILVQNNTINVNLEDKASIKLFSVSGNLIFQSVTDNLSQSLQSGIYILQVNEKSYKVSVK